VLADFGFAKHVADKDRVACGTVCIHEPPLSQSLHANLRYLLPTPSLFLPPHSVPLSIWGPSCVFKHTFLFNLSFIFLIFRFSS
jgi:hypothetical protein